MERPPLFFTLHLSKDSNIKQIFFCLPSISINCISKYYNSLVIHLKYICNKYILLCSQNNIYKYTEEENIIYN